MKHKKFLLIILAVLQIPISSACSTFSDNMSNGNTASESTDATEILSSNLNHIEITQYDSPGHELSTIPLYFQQDYTSTPYNGGTLAEYGSLVTCLSMLESFYQADIITPDKYTTLHDVNNLSSTDLIEHFASDNGREVHTYSFDAELLGSLLIDDRREVLLYIPHASIYGAQSSYMILTTVSENAFICVRDPNQLNVQTLATYANSEPMYNATILCEQASASSFIYVFTEKPKQ